MKTICAWREHEGNAVVLVDREPANERGLEYTICDRHTARLVAQLHKYVPPGAARDTSRRAA